MDADEIRDDKLNQTGIQIWSKVNQLHKQTKSNALLLVKY
jgi:hypothetical protein